MISTIKNGETMTSIPKQHQRTGVALPVVTVCLIGLISFVALAIDIGLMIVARTQCQNAADIAALAGARTLNGKDPNNNVTAASAMALTAATNNAVLNTAISASQVVAINAGIFRYDTTAQHFTAVFGQTPGANEAYGAMQVMIVTQQPTIFSRILGVQALNVGAVATAVHRPRDLAVVLDFSGSMAYCSLYNYPWGGSSVTGSLNPDPNFPTFGPWSIWGGSGMVLDPNNPPASPSNLNTYTPPTAMQRVFSYIDSTGQAYAPNNLTTVTRNGNALVNNFVLSDNVTSAFVSSATSFPSFTNVNVSTSGNPTGIVTPAPATFANQNASNFVGDKFPLRYGVTVSGTTAPTPDQYAQTVADYLGIPRSSVQYTTFNQTFEQYGYDWDFSSNSLKPASERFQGFTMGPGYFGKTFYMWPPDPRAWNGQIGQTGYVAGDWRGRFFLPVQGSGMSTQDNSMFWGINGRWIPQSPGSYANYIVNYNNILQWLQAGPQTLPPSLRAGRVIYYDSIPSTIPVDPTTGFILSTATQDQQFWKEYIDYVLGTGRFIDAQVMNGANNVNANQANGANLNYNNPTSSSLLPQITSLALLQASSTGGQIPYMNYTDNPVHPRMQFWFGPQSMMGFLQYQSNWLPGNCLEAPCWQLKVGINAALNDIQNNHPNDMAAMIFFSGSSNYNVPRVSMGKQYVTMQNALFYPFTLLDFLGTSSATMRPFQTVGATSASPSGIQDATDAIIPNAAGETCPQMGFELAFNEFSNASTSSTTYLGRRGAAKIVIFETDGVPNVTCSGSLTQAGGSGPGYWYYSNIGNAQWQSVSLTLHSPPKDDARAVVRQIVALDSANPPGYSTVRNPAQVHAIAFGELFEPTTPSAMQPSALRFLAAVQIDGNTSPTPPGTWDNDSLDYQTYYSNLQPYKIITGSATDRIAKISQAMQTIMQSGVSVALIQ